MKCGICINIHIGCSYITCILSLIIISDYNRCYSIHSAVICRQVCCIKIIVCNVLRTLRIVKSKLFRSVQYLLSVNRIICSRFKVLDRYISRILSSVEVIHCLRLQSICSVFICRLCYQLIVCDTFFTCSIVQSELIGSQKYQRCGKLCCSVLFIMMYSHIACILSYIVIGYRGVVITVLSVLICRQRCLSLIIGIRYRRGRIRCPPRHPYGCCTG